MNFSIYCADRTTHLRVVAVAIAISIAIVGFAVGIRVSALGMVQASAYPSQVVKAGRS